MGGGRENHLFLCGTFEQLSLVVNSMVSQIQSTHSVIAVHQNSYVHLVPAFGSDDRRGCSAAAAAVVYFVVAKYHAYLISGPWRRRRHS